MVTFEQSIQDILLKRYTKKLGLQQRQEYICTTWLIIFYVCVEGREGRREGREGRKGKGRGGGRVKRRKTGRTKQKQVVQKENNDRRALSALSNQHIK